MRGAFPWFEESVVSSFRHWSSAFALLFCFAPSAEAASESELAEIRAQIRELRSQYESRIQALEGRLKEAEDRASVAATAQPAAPPAPLAESGAAGSSLSAFNPAISAILAGGYANLSRDPAAFGIAGFARGGETGPGRRGFSLGESELVLSANVDPRFAGNLILSVSPEDTLAVEEAYGQWLTAPYGMSAKFGRFLSGIGYLNEQHAHAWDFVDAPLAYQALLGGQYANDGVQARWIAPLEHFVELGAEVGSGSHFPGTDRSKNGAGSAALYAHTGGDIGVSQSWRAGLSYLSTRAQDRPFELAANDAIAAFSGTSRVAIADFVWKYAPNGNTRESNAKLQGEYLWRRESGELAGLPPLGTAAYSSRQSGWYVQGVYQWHPEWRAGLRFDRLDPGRVDFAANSASFQPVDFRPRRTSVMVDYNPSEFSRIRLQYARSETLPGTADNQWFVQYLLSLGAHGAHKY
jgi:hypothetical protein